MNHPPTTKEKGMTAKDKTEFCAYCRQVSSNQLRNVYLKELKAGRTGYANIAKSVMNERGV